MKTYKEYHEGDKLKREICFWDSGDKNWEKEYDLRGTLVQQIIYQPITEILKIKYWENGNERAREVWLDGSLLEEIKYDDEEKMRLCKSYDTCGELTHEERWNVDNSGSKKTYHNGRLYKETEYDKEGNSTSMPII